MRTKGAWVVGIGGQSSPFSSGLDNFRDHWAELEKRDREMESGKSPGPLNASGPEK